MRFLKMFVVCAAVGASPAALLSAEGPATSPSGSPARSVLVAVDNTPFSIGEGEIVRLLARGIAGTKFEISVVGPGKVVAENRVSVLRRGRSQVGALYHEYEIQPTGTGRVIVKVTTTPPQVNAPQTVLTYEFDVK